MDVDVRSYRQKHELTTRYAFAGILRDAEARAQAKILKGVLDKFVADETSEFEFERNRVKSLSRMRKLIERLESDGLITVSDPAEARQAVRQALRDADSLIVNEGPMSAVDRVHTALHGFLRQICEEASIHLADDSSLTSAYKALRTNHPMFAQLVGPAEEIRRALGALASAMDSLNTVRNRNSLAHPNEDLLDPIEAGLYINIARTVFTYIQAKTSQLEKEP